jgi:hypothetical protein
MLPLQIVIENNMPEAATDWWAPLAGLIGVLIVTIGGYLSLQHSDERRRAQEDRRRWDTELVDAAVKMLVLTDDVAATDQLIDQKKKDILAGDFPDTLYAHMTKIGLLSNDHLSDLAQAVVVSYMRHRFAIKAHLESEVAAGGSLNEVKDVPSYSLASTCGREYMEAREQFQKAFTDLVVSVDVQRFHDTKPADWWALIRSAQEYEKQLAKTEAEPKHRVANIPAEAPVTRDFVA